MADFVRGNPDAPVAAMFIHLSLQKRYPRTEPNTADLFVLSLFHSACVAAIKFEADQAAEEAAKARRRRPPVAGPVSRRCNLPSRRSRRPAFPRARSVCPKTPSALARRWVNTPAGLFSPASME
jgi:hypothetical protein